VPRFEYTVVPAPKKGVKVKSAKTSEDRFAHVLMTTMNDMAREGWEYMRAETLPMQERKGLTGSVTTYQNVLVFRRAVSDAEASLTPPRLELATDRAVPALSKTAIGPADRAGKAPMIGPARTAPATETDRAPDADDRDPN
jgi:hypothetical protein